MRVAAFIAGLYCGFSCFCAEAGLRHYEARVDEAQWKASSSRLLCTLTQEIPGFGRARFSNRNGRDAALQFELQSQLRDPGVSGSVSWSSLAPAWMPGVPQQSVDTLPLGKGASPVQLQAAQAHRVLLDLETGRLPSFTLDSRYTQDSLMVSVSSVHFSAAADKFRLCLARLLPYTFADIARSTVYFELDKTDLTPAGAVRLQQIRDYLSADHDIDQMLIEGHTDNQGGRWMNKQLGMKRAEVVRDYLLKSGVDAKLIKISSEGERKPAANNKTEQGRALNRRVVIRISK